MQYSQAKENAGNKILIFITQPQKEDKGWYGINPSFVVNSLV